MGCFDVNCPLCGVSLNGVYVPPNLKMPRSKWTTRCTILLPGTKPQHGFREVACNISFENIRTGQVIDVGPGLTTGIVLHTDCWKFATTVLKRPLSSDDFDLSKLRDAGWFLIPALNYSHVRPYFDQFFNVDKLATVPKDWYLMQSPMSTNAAATKNKRRIKGNIKALQRQRPKARPAPVQSAKLFPDGFQCRGSDGRLYSVKVVGTKRRYKRWVRA